MSKHHSAKGLSNKTGNSKSAKTIQRLSKTLATASAADVAQCLKTIEMQCGKGFAAHVKLNLNR